MSFQQSAKRIHDEFRAGIDEKDLVRRLEHGGLHLIGSIVAEQGFLGPYPFHSYHSRELSPCRPASDSDSGGSCVYACDCGGDDPKFFTDYLRIDGDRAVFAVQRPFDVGVTDFVPRFVRDFQFYLGSLYSALPGGLLSIHATLKRVSERKEISEYFGEVRELQVLDGTPMDLEQARLAVALNIKAARERGIELSRRAAHPVI